VSARMSDFTERVFKATYVAETVRGSHTVATETLTHPSAPHAPLSSSRAVSCRSSSRECANASQHKSIQDRVRGVCPAGGAILSGRDVDSRAARAHRHEVILTFLHGFAPVESRQRHQVSFTEDGPMVLIASRGPSAGQTVHARRWIDLEKMYGLHNLRSSPRCASSLKRRQ
jgi:hypothetical protein